MSIREEQCRKVCRILDDVLAKRPTERDALCVAVDKAFEALKQSEQQRTGKWILGDMCSVKGYWAKCSVCGHGSFGGGKFCRECGAKMEGTNNETD